MFLKQFITIPHSKDVFFRVHSHAFNSFIFAILCENRKRSLILSDAVPETTESWKAELLDSLILINVVPGISVVVKSLGYFLINVVGKITKLWVENSQKINCCDVTSMREGRVSFLLFFKDIKRNFTRSISGILLCDHASLGHLRNQ